MRSALTPYPVDRYLVESRKKIDMVNIINEDIWNPEPALRPEDEIILRKLHDMLQSTADDLKLLSGELSKHHEPRVQVKTLAMPLDEEFNDKVHVEEVVKAKFYGNKLVDPNHRSLNIPQKSSNVSAMLSVINESTRKNVVNRSVQVNNVSTLKKQPIKNNLQISHTKTMEITEKHNDSQQTQNHAKIGIASNNKRTPTISYKEFSYNNLQPNRTEPPLKSLQIQEMPKINIRSELTFQKVLQLDILPESTESHTQKSTQHNTLVVEMQHEPVLKQKDGIKATKFVDNHDLTIATKNRPTMRKVSTMSAYESSESNNISSDSHYKHQKQKRKFSINHASPRLEQKSVQKSKKNKEKGKSRSQIYIDEWKKRLNTIYSRPSNSKDRELNKEKQSSKYSCKKPIPKVKTKEIKENIYKNLGLNNTEYVPYSKLTLGGVNVSDVEKELLSIPNSNNIVLSPMLDKMLSSRENSFHNVSPRKNSQNKNKIFTTSDENLLQEVLEIQTKVANTLTNNERIKKTTDKKENDSTKDLDSYADDFEDEKSDASEAKHIQSEDTQSSPNSPSDHSRQDIRPEDVSKNTNERNKTKNSVCNLTHTKLPKLSFKNSVDIFEFIHSIDTQETGTQSNTSKKITPKETQTSPRLDKTNVRPIHNDLWSSIDPRGEVERMLRLEKEFIKKLIIDEYGDLLEKSLNKPSTSEKIDNGNDVRNAAASQKITQTSPAHVKNIMTSPIRFKTRTTSPFAFALSLNVNQQTSPINIVPDEDVNHGLEDDGDYGISANLSSPRFRLRIPQTARDVPTQFESNLRVDHRKTKCENLNKNVFSSSSSVDDKYSSSDISSLGEINKKFKKLRKSRIPSVSEISSSSSLSKYTSDPSGAILPLRSEGETSIGPINRRSSKKQSRSEGEISLGQLR